MFQKLDLLKTAMSMARHAGYKQALTSQNIANADTPGFRSRRVKDFSSFMPVPNDRSPLKSPHIQRMNSTDRMSVTPVTMKVEEPNGNGVVLENEILESVDAKRQHDRALSIYQASLGMLKSVLSKQ